MTKLLELLRAIPSPLPGFQLETIIAHDKGINQVTLARARKAGLIEYFEWGGRIWDKTEGSHSVDSLIRSKVTRRNPPRTPRRARRTSTDHQPTV
jgi:hypothetical protein